MVPSSTAAPGPRAGAAVRAALAALVFASAFVAFAGALVLGSGDAEARTYTTRTNVDTMPTGAECYLVKPGGVEEPLGLTPLSKVRLPRGMITLRFKKDGHETLDKTVKIERKTLSFVFNMVRVIEPAVLQFIAGDGAKGATVMVDGKGVGEVPTEVKVPPGRHQAIVDKPGFEAWERWIDVTEGQRVTFEVVLKAQEKAKGSILVSTSPAGAQVRVNGILKGTSPMVVESLDPAEYLVELSLEGHESATKSVTVDEGGRAIVNVTLASSKPKAGTLRVLSDVEGTEVTVNGEPKGGAPFVWEDAPPGQHLVEGRAEGHEPVSQTVQVTAGETTVLKLELVAATKAAVASVRVVAMAPGAMVSVDGDPAQPAPRLAEGLPPGTHTVVVSADGHAPYKETVTLVAGELREIVADLQQAGQLEVLAPTTGGSEVFLDGDLVGRTPYKDLVPTGTYTVLVKRADGKTETHQVAVGVDAPVVVKAEFGAVKAAPKHRAMPYSAQPIDPNRGTVDLHIGFPNALGVRFNTGLMQDLEIGVGVQSMLFTIANEIEVRAKYLLLRNQTLALSYQGALVGGIGSRGRGLFEFRSDLLGSMLINERVAVTLGIRVGLGAEWIGEDVIRPAQTKEATALVNIGGSLTVEWRVSTYWNLFIRATGEYAAVERRLTHFGLMFANKQVDRFPMVGGSFGASVLF